MDNDSCCRRELGLEGVVLDDSPERPAFVEAILSVPTEASVSDGQKQRGAETDR